MASMVAVCRCAECPLKDARSCPLRMRGVGCAPHGWRPWLLCADGPRCGALRSAAVLACAWRIPPFPHHVNGPSILMGCNADPRGQPPSQCLLAALRSVCVCMNRACAYVQCVCVVCARPVCRSSPAVCAEESWLVIPCTCWQGMAVKQLREAATAHRHMHGAP